VYNRKIKKQKPGPTIVDKIRMDLEKEMLGEDIYSEQGLMENLENDEITAAEMGFMQGYLAA